MLGFRIPKGDEMNVKILDIGRVLIIRLATRHPEKETPGKEAVFVRADGSLCPWQAGAKPFTFSTRSGDEGFYCALAKAINFARTHGYEPVNITKEAWKAVQKFL